MDKHVCPWWLAYTFDNPLRKLFHNPEQIFSPFVSRGMTVADIGCGLGYFSIALSKIVDQNGKVFAVDVQEKMLDILMKRAHKSGAYNNITPLLCRKNCLTIAEPLDVAVAFWMLHETPDCADILRQLHRSIKVGGLLLMTEPKFHVSRALFDLELEKALQCGFIIKDKPDIMFSHAAWLEKSLKTVHSSRPGQTRQFSINIK